MYLVTSGMDKCLVLFLACSTLLVGWYQYQMIEKLRTLQIENTELAARFGTLEERSKNQQAVAVYVRMSRSLPLTGNARVMYDVEVTNIGKAFNLQKGEFTTSVAGVYMIHVTLCLGSGNQWMRLNIIENDKVIGRVFSGDTVYISCGSETISIYLDVGDTVWVQRADGIAKALDQNLGWNSFTATLIQADYAGMQTL